MTNPRSERVVKKGLAGSGGIIRVAGRRRRGEVGVGGGSHSSQFSSIVEPLIHRRGSSNGQNDVC